MPPEPDPACLGHLSTSLAAFPLSLKSKERFGCIRFAGWGLGQMAGRCSGNEKVG